MKAISLNTVKVLSITFFQRIIPTKKNKIFKNVFPMKYECLIKKISEQAFTEKLTII